MFSKQISSWQVETALRLGFGIDTKVKNGPFDTNKYDVFISSIAERGVKFTADGGISIQESYGPYRSK